MNEFLASEGYEGLDPLQADLIFRTNIQTAYNVGHYEQMTDPGVMKLRPYWQYDAVNDAHTRPSHLAMDGRVFPADSAVWDSWFPPNGFRCRCTVKTLSKRQVEARGLKVEQSAPAFHQICFLLPIDRFKPGSISHAAEGFGGDLHVDPGGNAVIVQINIGRIGITSHNELRKTAALRVGSAAGSQTADGSRGRQQRAAAQKCTA